MTKQRDETRPSHLIGSLTVDAAIRIGLLGLLLYWSLKVIGPFLTIALWSAILTVALYPLFDLRSTQRGNVEAGRQHRLCELPSAELGDMLAVVQHRTLSTNKRGCSMSSSTP